MKENDHKRMCVFLAAVFLIIAAPSCRAPGAADGPGKKPAVSVRREDFGRADGRPISMYILSNANGLEARIMDYGAILYSFRMPDRNGTSEDITLGYSTLEEFVNNRNNFGATIGRYANRIAGGTFRLNDRVYLLAKNDHGNHLHGGLKGFNKVVWDSQPVRGDGYAGVRLRYLCRDGEEGYPGNLKCTILYTLTEDNELRIDYEAQTDRATPVNLTNHTFWNLSGDAKRDILEHQLQLNADFYLPADERLIPTGEILSVHGTPMDFTAPAPIGGRIAQVKGGYDHNYVLRRESCDRTLVPAARVYDPLSGRTMEIFTTEPGIQFYSGNFFDGSVIGKGGRSYHKYQALCLETQHFPDSPNRPYFPNTILEPGRTYTHTCVHKFTVEK